MEIWKDIKGYEGLYQVSNEGNVQHLAFRKGSTPLRLKPSVKNGYYFVVLSKENTKKNFYVHRLVAQAFVEKTAGNDFVNHKDECKTNNRSDNLEWCTQTYNNAYGTRTEREVATKSKQVEQLHRGIVIRKWNSTREAQRAGFWSGCIALCCNGKRKSHAGYEWRWAI